VSTRLRDSGNEAVKVIVESDCGTVTDPTQPGDSSTTVACDRLGQCSITIRVVDERYERCDGTSSGSSAVVDVQCQVDI
jgi:hypothetical protein